MAQTFYPTASTIITRALTDLGAIDPEGGITPSAAQTTDALQVLNFLITSYQGHGMQVWCQKQGVLPLTADTNSYTLGPGGDLNIARPLNITQAWLRDTNTTPNMDIPVLVKGREEYNLLSGKTVPGSPNLVFYDPQYDLPGSNSGASAKGKLYVWPVPTAALATQYDLYFTYTRPIQDFSATSDTLDFPQEWYDAIRWNLALSLAPSYEVPVMKWDRIKAMARDTLELALASDRSTVSVTVSPATHTNA